MDSLKKTAVWQMARDYAYHPLRRLMHMIQVQDHLPLFWHAGSNWGDSVNPLLAGMLSGRPVLNSELYCDCFMAVGSTLGLANRHTRVWGSGMISPDDLPREMPRSIHAVRGPLTRERLDAAKIPCPDIFGDPVLLLPRFYNPIVEKRFKVGIIPHYADRKSPWLDPLRARPEVAIIDVLGDLLYFVRMIKSCDVILSSSLHGLISADAYGVPSVWIKLSDDVQGGDFKFRDYYLSTGCDHEGPAVVTVSSSLSGIAGRARLSERLPDLAALILSCPFLSDALRREIVLFRARSEGIPPTLKGCLDPDMQQMLAGVMPAVRRVDKP